MPNRILTIQVFGERPISKKNNYRRAANGGLYLDDKVKPYTYALQAAAMEAVHNEDFPPLVETPFILEAWLWVKSYGSVDLDGATTTILDALQGIVYDDDKYCAAVYATKELFRPKLGESWMTLIKVSAK